jgi:hypothetical protein
LVKALVSEPFSDWPEMPARLPAGTKPDDVIRASFYYGIGGGGRAPAKPPVPDHDDHGRSNWLFGDLGIAALYVVANEALSFCPFCAAQKY